MSEVRRRLPMHVDYLRQKNHATRQKMYQAVLDGRALHRTHRTALGAMVYRRRVAARWEALRAAVAPKGPEEQHAPAD